MIVLEGVSLKIGTFSLGEISLSIRGGTYTFLMGPSGAGKTLILEMIAGIHAPDSGRILIDGTDVTHLPPDKRRVGFVYQDYSLFPHYTIRRNIAFGMRMHGQSRPKQDREIHELLDMLGISHLADRYPLTLSGGEQQRVALARALAIEPGVLLLDEPFAALDYRAREECMEGLQRVHRERGITILQVSHSREEAYSLADEVALIDGGILLQAGPLSTVFSHPAGRKAAAIAGFENILEGTVTGLDDGILDLDIGGTIVRIPGDVPVGSSVAVGIRAGSLHLTRHDHPPVPGRNYFRGTVSSVIYTDYTCRIALDGAPVLVVAMPKEQAGLLEIRAGDPVWASFDAMDTFILEPGVAAR
ncbi:MAG: ABC transporter ATP-binding protein [Methanoregulaceae archaeon]|nr:ABC transporter ATP-binding protein [Methanoregulaceae archaeon]